MYTFTNKDVIRSDVLYLLETAWIILMVWMTPGTPSNMDTCTGDVGEEGREGDGE